MRWLKIQVSIVVVLSRTDHFDFNNPDFSYLRQEINWLNLYNKRLNDENQIFILEHLDGNSNYISNTNTNTNSKI